MTRKQFQRYLDRDGGCVHCGDTETAVPNHRANRGMGGSKERDVPSNVVVLCANLNGLIESDQVWADVALSNGWKLRSGQNPVESPYYDLRVGRWYLADDYYNRITYLKKGQLDKPQNAV
jgi:hypothetical protein